MMVTNIVLTDRSHMPGTPAEIMSFVNTHICEHNDMDMFVTIWLGILELSTGRITAANAGHEDAFICRGQGDFELFRTKHDFVVGGMPETTYTDYELQLEKGDRLFIYTDGIPEATAKDNSMFGLNRMKAALNTNKEGSPRQILEGVHDAIIEFYVGAENISDTGYTLPDFINAAYASISTETARLSLRTGFTTKADATDSELIALNPSSGGILKSRIGIIEPLKFGKHAARLCCTPYYIEPGFLEYRTVEPGEFKSRTDAEILALQNAGIIFGADEVVSDLVVCRINLAVSTAFANNPRPADSLFHARFNADNLLRNVFKAVFTQVKANEAASYIVKAQTKVDAVIDEEVRLERMIPYNNETGDGTKLTLVESDSNPYDMELKGQIQGINCTTAIIVKAKIKNPAVIAVNE